MIDGATGRPARCDTVSKEGRLDRPALHNNITPLRIIVSVEQFHAPNGPNNATRLSGKEWLCPAARA